MIYFRQLAVIAYLTFGAIAYATNVQEPGAAAAEPRVTLEQITANPGVHVGKLVELTGRVAGTIHSDRGRTFMIDTGAGGYVYVRNAPDSAIVQSDSRVTITARVPKEYSGFTELDFVRADPAKPEPPAQKSSAATEALLANRVNSKAPSATPARSTTQSAGRVAPSSPPTKLDGEIARLRPSYMKAIAHFNSRLSSAQREQIADAILRFSLSNGLDPRLTMAIIAVESAFKPNATSHCGAMGLGQLMPGTAAGMGVRDAYDPVENVHAAVKIIRGHLENYKYRSDSFNVALAAYNAGSGAVRRHGGVPPYNETVRYIWKIYNLYKQLAPDAFRS